MVDPVMTEAQARLYKTAIFAEAAHTLEASLPVDPVRITYMGAMFNAFYGVDEPVFATFRTMDDSSYIGSYFARALKDFAL